METKFELSDLNEREKALNEKKSYVVIAPAGSGKTELLIRRFLKLLKNAKSIDSVAAITYTRKAQEEIKERIFKAIYMAIYDLRPQNQKEVELKEIARGVLENKRLKKEELLSVNSYLISTFHGFCKYILKKFPTKDISTDFETLDEISSSYLYEIVAQKILYKAKYGEDEELRVAIIRRATALNGNFENLKKQIVTLIENRDRILNLKEIDCKNQQRLIDETLKAMGERVYKWLKENENSYRELATYFIENNLFSGITTNVPKIDKESLPVWAIIRKIFLTGENVRQRKTGDFGELNDDLFNFVKSFPKECIPELVFLSTLAEKNKNEIDANAIEDIKTILNNSLEILNSLFSKNLIDFTGLELQALNLLEWLEGAPSRAIESLNQTIEHILVDEAQDLNDTEMKIIEKLTEGWEDGDGRTLFFVGDPKQSIYRFKKANVALFNNLIKNGFLRRSESPLKLEKINLRVNFRSEPVIIDFVNNTFKNIFNGYDFYDDVEYTTFSHPKIGQKKPSFTLNQRVRELPSVSLFLNFEDGMEGEVKKSFVNSFKKVISEKGEGETIAILYRNRKSFEEYREALEIEGLNVEVIENVPLIDKPTIKHIFNLLNATLNKEDDFLWSAILSNPIFDFDISKISQIANEEGSWFEKITKTPLIDDKKRNQLKLMVEDFYLKLNGENFIKHFEALDGYYHFARVYGSDSFEEIKVFFDILRSLAENPPNILLHKMETILENTYAPSNPLLYKSKALAMTIHRSKGLEFDYVFLVGIEKESSLVKNDSEPIIIERANYDEQSRDFNFLVAPYQNDEFNYLILRELCKKREERELMRLYYVATTRAKKGLYLFALNKTAKKGSFLEKLKKIYDLKEKEIEIEEVNFQPPKSQLKVVEKSYQYEEIPYKLERASEEVDFALENITPIKTNLEETNLARARGILIHKILEIFALGKEEIPISFVTKHLLEMKIKERDVAMDILQESKKCFEKIKELKRGGELIPEAPYEMVRNKSLISGRIDLMIKKKDEIILIDYKTVRLNCDDENKIYELKEKYSKQIEIYKEMAKEYFKTENIKSYIFFTNIQRLEMV